MNHRIIDSAGLSYAVSFRTSDEEAKPDQPEHERMRRVLARVRVSSAVAEVIAEHAFPISVERGGW